jgi:phage RecT family recombinase
MTTSLLEKVREITGVGEPAPAAEGPLPVPQPVGEATPAQVEAVDAYLDKHGEKFRAALPAHVPYEAFRAAVAMTLPRVARCTPASLLQSFLTCARFGLVPDGYEAAIEVQGSQAVFIPTYKGYVRLMYRSGLVESVHAGLIHANDEWTVTPSAPAPDDFVLKIRPELSAEERGPVVCAYAFVRMRGGGRSQVMFINNQKADEIRDEYSYGYRLAVMNGREDSYWHRKRPEMMRKTALKALFPFVPTSAELVALAEAEDAGHRGEVQVYHAPDPEKAALTAEAERAHRAAEGSQEMPPLPVKRSKQGRRYSGKKQRGGVKAGRR